MGRRQFVTAAFAVGSIVLAALTGCGVGDSADKGKPGGGTIRLGMLAPITGRDAPYGVAMVRAAQLAVKEANTAGGVLGRQVELLPVNDACDPGTAVDGANALVAKEIVVSVGGYCSSATVPTMKIFRQAGIPMIVPLSNSTELLNAGYDSVFLLSGTVSAEAAFAVTRIAHLGGRRLALVHDGTSFPQTLAAATAKALPARGKLSVVATLEMTQGAPSYARIADAVLASRADTVYFTGYNTDAHQLVVDLRVRGYAGVIVVGDGSTSALLLSGLNEHHIHDLYGTALLIPEFMPETDAWAERYKAMFGNGPPSATIEAYDAVVLALDAIRRAGSLDRPKVTAAIRRTENTSLLSGPIRFAPNGARVNPRFLLLKAEAKGFTLVADSAVG